MFSWLVYLVRLCFISAGNLLKKGMPSPDYVFYTLQGHPADLKAAPQSFLEKRMRPRDRSLQEIETDFRRIAAAPGVKGIILHPVNFTLSFSQAQSLMDMIKKLREAGKEVFTWAAAYDTAAFCLAAAGEKILLQEGGAVYSLGFASRQLFMKNALQWCGIELDAVRVGPYKTALDRYTHARMSEEARRMTEWLLDSHYKQLVEAIARGRKMTTEEVGALIEKTPLCGEKAVNAGAVDKIINAEDLPGYLGGSKPVRLVAWEECSRTFSRPLPLKPGKFIALLRVEGSIVEGYSSRPPSRPPLPLPFLFNERTGHLTFVRQARQIRKNRRIKAVLLYINSGGGSAAASEAIWAALDKVAAQKPVVALMGSVAGSGGYYVATPALYIVARPSTITGSIGVIMAKVVDSRLLNRLLLKRETVFRGEKDLFASTDEPFTDEERKKARALIDDIYTLFIRRVSDSRSLTAEEVENIGGGRVWTGEQALGHGLVDKLGGLETALSHLRDLAKLPAGTPLVEMPLPGRETAPPPVASSWLNYALEGLSLPGNGRALLVDPLFFFRPPDRE